MAASKATEIVGLKEFRKELRRLDNPRVITRELGAEFRGIAKDVEGWSQSRARALGGPFAHFAKQIKGRGGATGARITVGSDANATFWGAKASTGWNAGNDGRPQHPEWVGTGWDVGGTGGPYAINAAIRAHEDQIVDDVGDAIERIAAKAFPD